MELHIKFGQQGLMHVENVEDYKHAAGLVGVQLARLRA